MYRPFSCKEIVMRFHGYFKLYNIVQMEVKYHKKVYKKVKEQSHNRSVFQKNSKGQKLIHLLSKLGLVSSKKGSHKKKKNAFRMHGILNARYVHDIVVLGWVQPHLCHKKSRIISYCVTDVVHNGC